MSNHNQLCLGTLCDKKVFQFYEIMVRFSLRIIQFLLRILYVYRILGTVFVIAKMYQTKCNFLLWLFSILIQDFVIIFQYNKKIKKIWKKIIYKCSKDLLFANYYSTPVILSNSWSISLSQFIWGTVLWNFLTPCT